MEADDGHHRQRYVGPQETKKGRQVPALFREADAPYLAAWIMISTERPGAANLASTVARAVGLTGITAGDQIRKSNLDGSAGPVAVKPKLMSASASTFPFQAALRTT